ncbi:MAG: KTSC domain-containing protein [Lautropia sp.]
MKPNHRMLHPDRLRSAHYDSASQELEIALHDGKLQTYRGVPAEVARRFFASPNPASFWEDRIREEYPVTSTRAGGGNDAARKLDDLFGGG